jgi:acyl-CoA thioesterase YciA
MSRIPKIIDRLVLQTLAMPRNTNTNGDIFGGWIVSQMDLGAAIIAQNVSNGRVTTVAINNVKFTEPILIGDIVSCKGTLLNVGTTSMTIKMSCSVQRKNEVRDVSEGVFTFVAITDSRKPRPVTLLE